MRRIVAVSVAISLLVLTACGGEESARPVVTVRATDFSYEAPDTIAGGPATLRFVNSGQETHELHVMRLKDGVQAHQFLQSLHQDGLDVALQMGSVQGHVATIAGGQTAEAPVDLRAGEYALICQIRSPVDGISHALKGMVRPLTVTDGPEG